MPNRSKRSRAALARNAKCRQNNSARSKQENPISDQPENNRNKCTNQNRIHLDILGISYNSTVRGSFHQGDVQFSAESRGVQCSCNALVMLCKIDEFAQNITPARLDNVLRHGDELYRNIAQKLLESGQVARSGYLELEQLPSNVSVRNLVFKIEYCNLQYGRLHDDPSSVFEPLDVELQAAFTVSEKAILVIGDSMMALYKDSLRDQYVFFDSHSRNESGFPTSEGNAFAITFPDIDNLVGFLYALARKLNLHNGNFGIQPVKVIHVVQDSYQTNQNQSSTMLNKAKDNSGCSTSTIDDISDSTNCTSSRKCSRWQKWYDSLSVMKQNEVLESKRKRSYEQYQSPEYAEFKRLRAQKQTRQSYENPESAQRKRQQSRQSYGNPEVAQRKRQQSRQSYENPEIAQRKRQQARQQSRQSYENPEIAQRKRQQSRKSYENPEIAQLKRQQARQQSRKSYENPEIAQRKRAQSRQSYENPQNAKRKRQQTQAHRIKEHSDINTIISDFQKSCKEDQLIYICQICQRIFFKKQVVALYANNYNRAILTKSLPSHVNINALPTNEKKKKKKKKQKEKENQNTNESWLCYTCHQNLLSNRVPRLATVNKLALAQQPDELSQLNMLERHLVSPAILFMKMITLIKGAQKGINGQVVCVKSNVNDTVACLPRLPTEQSLLRVKLKRRLIYKGHHMCQNVNPHNIRQALRWLKVNNPVYEHIDINFDDFDSMLDDDLIEANHIDEENNEEMLDNPNNTDEEIHQHEASHNHNNNKDDGNSASDNENDNNDNNEDNITNTSAPLYSFLHPVDFAQYLADKSDESILCIAPGEGNSPEIVLNMEAKCFPAEFPTAANTFNEIRENKLKPARYFNARLFSADNRFARNPEYIFFALYATEVQQIYDNISIAVRRGNTKTTDGQEITASMLTDYNEMQKLIQRDEGYKFLAKVRGTPAFWESTKKDVFAMIRQLGIPTFFITFSAADRRWMEIDNAILISQGKRPMTAEQHQNMTWEEHCEIIMSNPTIAARMFQQRVKTFINNVILSPANPIGEVEDYFYRTEFQQRGWPHIHMIAWVKDAPVFGDDPDEQIVEFVDKHISCALPPEDDTELHDIVSNVQMHAKRHTKSCRKTGQVCRFNFPKPPSNKTFICKRAVPPEVNPNMSKDEIEQKLAEAKEEERKAKETLQNIWDTIESSEDTDFDEILCLAQTTQDEFENCLAVHAKRNNVYLKRRVQDRWVNNYNPHLIRCWNGNMDIQYILDPFAAAMYMLSYLTKTEREMGDLLKNAQREAREGNLEGSF